MLLSRWRGIVVCGIVLLFYLFYSFGSSGTSNRAAFASSKKYPEEEILRSLFLTEEQCAATFPGLTRDIDAAAERGSFNLKRAPDDAPGMVQGRIKDGNLYIISSIQDSALKRVGSVLHSLHRAIITSQTRLPDTVFALNIDDQPRPNTWSFARSDDQWTPANVWLMPHFIGWSWPVEYIGTLDEALLKIARIERDTTWGRKESRAVWRGTAWFNPEWSIGLRHNLVKMAEGEPWADVQITGQGHEAENNTLAIEEFCRYKYIIYAEGKTYSGRLPFHQACASIVLAPPPTFLLHTTHLMRPLFSSILLRLHEHVPLKPIPPPPPESYPVPATSVTWPLSYHPSEANVVFVRPDWSDLEDVVRYLEAHPETARDIARRQRETMVDKGYLSQAAEACYWRRLIRSWSETATWDDAEWSEGMRWETFSLLGKTTYT